MAQQHNGRVETPVGKSMPRIDGVAKVTGRAKYLDDLDAGHALHGATVRSKIPHGILEGFDRDPSFDWSQVSVATADDIPGHNFIHLIEDDQVALVPIGGTIRHVDEALALVAAPTREMAFAAARALRPRTTALPAIFTVEDALRADVKLHGDDNVYKATRPTLNSTLPWPAPRRSLLAPTPPARRSKCTSSPKA